MKSNWKWVLLCFFMCCFCTAIAIMVYSINYRVIAFLFIFLAGYWARYSIEIASKIFNDQKDEMARDYYEGRTTIKK